MRSVRVAGRPHSRTTNEGDALVAWYRDAMEDLSKQSIRRTVTEQPRSICRRLLHGERLPQLPGAARVTRLPVALGALFRRDVIDRTAEAERDRLHARVLIGEDRARHRDPHVRSDHDVAVPAHQRHWL